MIPSSLKSESESYITIPIMKKFCKAHDIKSDIIRGDMLNAIFDFAKLNEENESIFYEWIESVLKEGIKHIYIRKVYSDNDILEYLKDEENCLNLIDKRFNDVPNNYIVACESDIEIKLQNIHYQIDNEQVTKLSFAFTQIILDDTPLYTGGTRITYPIFVDIDLIEGYIIARAKSKTSLYTCTENDNDNSLSYDRKISTDDLVKNAINYITNILDLILEDKNRSTSNFKNSFYHILKEYTYTPEIIKEKIKKSNSDVNDFIDLILDKYDIDETTYFDKAKDDLSIFIEKYLSISHPDQELFTNGRRAYPVKLVSTDGEFTKVEEMSHNKEPLQCKEKFFDNKKSIEYEKTCDRLWLCYNRSEEQYFSKDPILVKISLKRGYCLVNFTKYTEEVDIDYVLSTIINHRGV